MSNKEQFKSITGVTDDSVADFYLSMCNNNVQDAIAMYFENPSAAPTQRTTSSATNINDNYQMLDEEEEENIPEEFQRIMQNLQQQQQQQQKPTSTGGRTLGSSSAPSSSAPTTTSSTKKSSTTSGNKRFASLRDYASGANEEGEEESDDSNKYYAGGSQHSGQQIIGASDSSKKPKQGNEITDELFKKAKEMGAKSYEEFQQSQQQEKFKGSGFRLGSVPSGSDAAVNPSKPTDQPKKERVITITFWEDGFSIDDGPLRSFDDPKNKEFLETVNRGYVPREVAQDASDVTVNLVKKEGKYVPPPKTFKAFEGSGRSLAASSSSSSSQQSSSFSSSIPTYKCNENEPHTTIQFRLSNGTKLTGKFNLNSTVKDLMNYVANQSNSGLNFELMQSFPKKVLSDVNQTIEQAGLKNAVLVQNMK